ncbi:MAG: hypothetical protein Q7R65_01500 [bacterium]|nr:hypothetical protein [bacterium]
MEQISFFLEKFKTLGLDSALIKKVFIEEVEKILNTKISSDDIKIKEGILYVKAHPALKSELFIKRQLFIDELSKVLGPIKVTGLR